MWKPTVSSDEIYHTAIAHSAKGSTWKDHKYVKKVNGRYIYSSDKAKGVEQIRGEAMNEKIAKENEASDKIKQAHEVIKKAQKKASAHDIHTTRATDESGKKNGYYEYNFKTNSPGTSHNKYRFSTKEGRAADIRSRIENADYGAAAAAKRDSTKKRENVARELAKRARDNYKEQGLSEKWYRNEDAEKWETVAKSASIRQKQEEAYNKKKSSKSTGTNSKKKTSKTKEYITDNKTGKKRSVDRSGKTINIKKLSEKNKKKK